MKRQAGWVAAEATVGLLGAVLTTFLVSRIIGPAEVGRAALAAALVMLAQPFVGFCFTGAMVQRAQLTPGDIASVLWTSQATAAGFVLAFTAIGLLTPDLLAPGTGPILAALALILPFNALEGAANGVVLRRQDFRTLAIRGICANLAGLATGLSLALAGVGAWAIVGQQLAFFGTSALIVAARAGIVPGAAFDRRTIAAMMPFAISAAGSGLVGRMGFRLFLLAVAGGLPALAGILQIAFRIVEVAREVPTPFIHRYGLPALSRLRDDQASFLRRLEALCRLSGTVFAPACVGLALCAGEVQAVLLGPGWADIAPPVRLLSLALALAAFGFPLPMAFVAVGRPSVSLALTLGGLALVLALTPFVPRGSGASAAAAWATMMLAELVAASLLAARVLGFRLRRQFCAHAVALLPAAAVGASILLADQAGLLPDRSSLALLLSKVAIGLVSGGALILLLGRRDWQEVARTVPEDPATEPAATAKRFAPASSDAPSGGSGSAMELELTRFRGHPEA